MWLSTAGTKWFCLPVVLDCFNKTGSHLSHTCITLQTSRICLTRPGMIVDYQPIACEIRGFFLCHLSSGELLVIRKTWICGKQLTERALTSGWESCWIVLENWLISDGNRHLALLLKIVTFKLLEGVYHSCWCFGLSLITVCPAALLINSETCKLAAMVHLLPRPVGRAALQIDLKLFLVPHSYCKCKFN